MSERLFDLDDVPEVPLFREPYRAKAARGAILDGRFRNDYPPSWHRCEACDGTGVMPEQAVESAVKIETFRLADLAQTPTSVRVTHLRSGTVAVSEAGGSELRMRNDAFARLMVELRDSAYACPDCLGTGSLKAAARRVAGHRCERCGHPYVPKGDARMLGVEPSPSRWSPCDELCTHLGPVRLRETFRPDDYEWAEHDLSESGASPADFIVDYGPSGELIRRWEVEAEWRVLTVHHLDGDKSNCRWWNLAALCQRCHLEIQAKVVLERVYPHEHSEWFRPHAAGWYAFAYLGEELTREETLARLDELLALERIA